MEDDLNTRKAAAQVLRGWKQAGVDFLPAARPDLEAGGFKQKSVEVAAPLATVVTTQPTVNDEVISDMARSAKPNVLAPSMEESGLIWPDPKPKGVVARQSALEVIRKEVVGCTLCKELASCRTQTVFGVGNIQPRLCFFGEAPGADEDKQGEPFVGRAGQLLDKIIEAMTLKREDVYILNTLKCRPPSNRTPLPDEVENCRNYFTRQLETLRPEFIVCLGACAAQALLRTKEAIGKLRGRAHDYRGIKVYATYHPAYLLRNPPAKRDVWDDMKIVMKEMGMAIPKS